MSGLGLQTVIKQFRGKYYYECQWTGAKITERYGIPKGEMGGEKRGTFVDPACAIAYIVDAESKGRVTREKASKLIEIVIQDLGLVKSGNTLISAPDVDQSGSMDFSYRKEHPYMVHPKSGYRKLEADLEKKGMDINSSDGKTSLKKSSLGKRLHVYTVLPEKADSSETGTQLYRTDCAQQEVVDFGAGILLKKLALRSYKGKDAILISEENSSEINKQIPELFPKNTPVLLGDVHMILRKPISSTSEGSCCVPLPSPVQKRAKLSKEAREIQINSQIESVLFHPKK